MWSETHPKNQAQWPGADHTGGFDDWRRLTGVAEVQGDYIN